MSAIQDFETQAAPLIASLTEQDVTQAKTMLQQLGIFDMLSPSTLEHLYMRCVVVFYPALKPVFHPTLHRTIFRLLVAQLLQNPDTARHIISTHTVDLFLATSRPERFDLYYHLNASDAFLVDGDSLVMDALCNVHVDWQLLQPLMVAHLVEKLLRDLIRRGGRFIIVFFACQRGLWSKDPQKLAVRELLRHRLTSKASANGFSVQQFADWWSPAFSAFVAATKPNFMFMTDGEQLVNNTQIVHRQYAGGGAALTANAAASSGTTAALLTEVDARTVVHSLVVRCLALQLTIVLSSRLLYKDNAILAFTLRSRSQVFVPAAM